MAAPTYGGFITSLTNGVVPMRNTATSGASATRRIVIFAIKIAGAPSDSKGNSYTQIASFGNLSIWMSGLIDTAGKALVTPDYIECPVGTASWSAHAFEKLHASGNDGVETLTGSYNGGGSDFILNDPGLGAPACVDYIWLAFGDTESLTGSAAATFNAGVGGHPHTGAGIGILGGVRYRDAPYDISATGTAVITGHVGNTFGDTHTYNFLALRWRSSDCSDTPPLATGLEKWSCNCRSHLGWFYRVYTVDGAVTVKRARFSQPPFDLTATIDSHSTGVRPVIVEDGRQRLWSLWGNGTAVPSAYSDDDGATWSAAVSLFASGKYPFVCSDPSTGALLSGAYVAGAIQFRLRYPGDADWRAAVTVKSGGATLAVEDDVFAFAFMADAAGRLILTARKSGATTITEFRSFDELGGTFTEIT